MNKLAPWDRGELQPIINISMEEQELKRHLHHHLVELMEEKVRTAETLLKSTEESKLSETKSSAGDKHETGRAMMQREEAQNKAQLAKALELKNTLSRLNFKTSISRIEFGSLVTTDQGVYYLSIGLGKIEVEGNEHFAISPVSPLGSALMNQAVGDKVVFLEKEYVITRIE